MTPDSWDQIIEGFERLERSRREYRLREEHLRRVLNRVCLAAFVVTVVGILGLCYWYGVSPL